MSCISKEEEALFGISPNVKQLSAEDAKKVAYIKGSLYIFVTKGRN